MDGLFSRSGWVLAVLLMVPVGSSVALAQSSTVHRGAAIQPDTLEHELPTVVSASVPARLRSCQASHRVGTTVNGVARTRLAPGTWARARERDAEVRAFALDAAREERARAADPWR